MGTEAPFPVARRFDKKIFSVRRPPVFGDQPTPEQAHARELAGALLAGRTVSPADVAAAVQARVGAVSCGWDRGRCRFEVAGPTGLPELPPGYFFKGGAARRVLGLALRCHAPPPRDLDIIRFGARWTAADAAVSRELMPQDFARGWGVELCRDAESYLGSRDISVNEVYAGSGAAWATPVAVLDMLGGLLRPCKYRSGTLHRPPTLKSAAVVKMLRLRAEGLVDGAAWDIVGIPADQPIELFDVALQLDKAFSRGRSTAEAFMRECGAADIFPPSSRAEDEFIERVAVVWQGVFEAASFFRNAPAEIAADVLRWIESQEADADEELRDE